MLLVFPLSPSSFPPSPPPLLSSPPHPPHPCLAEGSDLEASEYHALFSYQPETESELMFSAGDTVWVYWGQDNGWWFGATAGKQGWFPESYIEVRVHLG